MSTKSHYEFTTDHPTGNGMVPLKIRMTTKMKSKSQLKRLHVQRGLTSKEKAKARKMNMIISEDVINIPNVKSHGKSSTMIIMDEPAAPKKSKSIMTKLREAHKRLKCDRDPRREIVHENQKPSTPKPSSREDHDLRPDLKQTLDYQRACYEQALHNLDVNYEKHLALTTNQIDLLQEIFSKNNNVDLKRLKRVPDRDTKIRLGKSKMIISILKEFEDIAILVPDKKRKKSIIRLFGLTERQAKRIIIVKRLKERA